MKVVLASRNKNKIAELQKLLLDYIEDIELLSLDDVGIDYEIIEDGATFAENSLIKAKAAATSGYIGIGDDSGLSVDALGGAPGVMSARFSGVHGDDKANNRKLLREMENINDRDAEFICAISCVFPNDTSNFITATGVCRGEILREERGNGGFGYDPLFLCKEFGKTFSELSSDEKNSISHRGIAIQKFAQLFMREIRKYKN